MLDIRAAPVKFLMGYLNLVSDPNLMQKWLAEGLKTFLDIFETRKPRVLGNALLTNRNQQPTINQL